MPTAAATSMTAEAGVRYKRARKFREEFIIMEVNDKVPDFSVPNEEGQPVSLKDFRGKPVVLFFFPKADTPG
jgi:peroxiredoxin